jgi:hypothetical protein
MLATQSPTLFNTVPPQDYGHFFNEGKPDTKKLLKFLEFSKDDIAKATDIPMPSIRYDEKMPSELRKRLIEWATAINLVLGFFKNDQIKTMLWFSMPNHLLGEVSPKDMIRMGRFKKLLKFIQTALDENQR